MLMSDYSQSILKLNIKMRLHLRLSTNFDETPARYGFILTEVTFIHNQKSESLIDKPN